jgi:hypothetical protein
VLSQTEGAHGPRAASERLDEHPLPTLIYYGVDVVLSTDGPMVMQTSLTREYTRAHTMIEAVLSGEQPIRIAASDATVDGHVRGKEVPGDVDERELYVQDLTSAERSRFLHGYEKLFADADRYYLRRPKREIVVGRAGITPARVPIPVVEQFGGAPFIIWSRDRHIVIAMLDAIAPMLGELRCTCDHEPGELRFNAPKQVSR